jgi:trans-aconitate 2-methyltransferase
MLRQARERLPKGNFIQADLVDWTPPARTDLLFANASFQWLPDHAGVLRRMLQALEPGGVLAVQMPDNMEEPALALMSKVAGSGRWAGNPALAAAAREPLPRPQAYYDLLKPLCAQLDIWHTIYNHVMAGHEAIVEWFKGSALRPYLAALDPAMGAAFLAAHLEEIKQHYPARHDGKVLLPFPRVFIVAVR